MVLAALVLLGGCASDGERLDRLSTKVAGASGGSADQRLVAFLDEERRKPGGKGLVLIGLLYKGACRGGSITVEQIVGGKPVQFATLQYPRFEPHALSAGEYLIASAGCGTPIGGPHARFTVRAGEFVNVGTLVLDHRDQPLQTL